MSSKRKTTPRYNLRTISTNPRFVFTWFHSKQHSYTCTNKFFIINRFSLNVSCGQQQQRQLLAKAATHNRAIVVCTPLHHPLLPLVGVPPPFHLLAELHSKQHPLKCVLLTVHFLSYAAIGPRLATVAIPPIVSSKKPKAICGGQLIVLLQEEMFYRTGRVF